MSYLLLIHVGTVCDSSLHPHHHCLLIPHLGELPSPLLIIILQVTVQAVEDEDGGLRGGYLHASLEHGPDLEPKMVTFLIFHNFMISENISKCFEASSKATVICSLSLPSPPP